MDRISHLNRWIPHLENLGINALLLGPIFESSAHGYDTADYFKIDRRLGDEDSMAAFSRELHRRGVKLVLDAVFHHTGRDFPAFRDIRGRGETSQYREWYYLDFSRRSTYGDAFHYQGWRGHYDLAKLNLNNPEVLKHLLDAVSWWIDRFDIDGLRIDVAESIDLDFLRRLAAHCRARKRDFWLMGEVIHGDYRTWANRDTLDCTTNYQAYKGLWSSHNDRNYFEIAYALNREFGAEGIYRGLALYNFADNHDVDRVASILKNPAHLYPLYVLLMTMPGVPSIYYGSEYGIEGRKTQHSDAPLRPALDPATMAQRAPHPKLYEALRNLIRLRHAHSALRRGEYTQLHVAHEQFAFLRRYASQSVIVAVNASDKEAKLSLSIPGIREARAIDKLNGDQTFDISAARCTFPVNPRWARIMLVEQR